jgi:hypothetical protein
MEQTIFQYPLHLNEPTSFTLKVPLGSKVLGLVEDENPIRGRTYSLAVLVDPTEVNGEEIIFYGFSFGESWISSGTGDGIEPKYIGSIRGLLGHLFLFEGARRSLRPEEK